MRRSIRIIVTTAALCALAVTAQQNAAAEPKRGGAEDAVLVAMQRDLGLTATQVKTLRAQQDEAIKLDAKLRGSLGATFGGSWFDAGTGTLVVNVTDKARTAEVTKAGARAVVVKHSEATLDGIRAELDSLSGKGSVDGRAKSGQSVLSGLASWRVDPRTNSVVVTTIKGQQKPAALSAFARHGDAITYEQTEQAPRQLANWLDGGDEINGASCSAGFNLRNPSTGQGFLLTAGHCTNTGQANYGQGGYYLGPTLESWFPGYDDALIRNDNPGYWIQGPWVDYNPSNGGFINVSGYSDSLEGTTVCKSGITTKWTCGYITGKNETVQYDGVPSPVYGLTRHNACAEPGDSGGANVAALSVWSPEGVTSGGQSFLGLCLSKWGLTNVSWYFPIADSMAYYGPKYGITTW